MEFVESPKNKPRERWSSRWTFIIASVGSAIGLGNIWRFPFLNYKHGGGAFLIPYIMFLLVTGVPLLQTELALGATPTRYPLHFPLFSVICARSLPLICSKVFHTAYLSILEVVCARVLLFVIRF